MNPAELVVAILVIVFSSRLLRDYIRRDAASNAVPAITADDARLLAEEVAALRERVRVLERVVTDAHGASDLDRRIERLRDQ